MTLVRLDTPDVVELLLRVVALSEERTVVPALPERVVAVPVLRLIERVLTELLEPLLKEELFRLLVVLLLTLLAEVPLPAVERLEIPLVVVDRPLFR